MRSRLPSSSCRHWCSTNPDLTAHKSACCENHWRSIEVHAKEGGHSFHSIILAYQDISHHSFSDKKVCGAEKVALVRKPCSICNTNSYKPLKCPHHNISESNLIFFKILCLRKWMNFEPKNGTCRITIKNLKQYLRSFLNPCSYAKILISGKVNIKLILI